MGAMEAIDNSPRLKDLWADTSDEEMSSDFFAGLSRIRKPDLFPKE